MSFQVNEYFQAVARNSWAETPAPKGCIVTVDALNVQKEIAHEIREQETELRYYLSSLAPNAERASQVIREHWGVETSPH